MNVADVLIALFFVASLIRGVELGLLQQVFSTSGLIGGLFAGAYVQQQLIQPMPLSNSKAFWSIVVVLGIACIGLFMGEVFGGQLKLRVRATENRWLTRADKAGGSIIAGLTLLVAVWLISGLASRAPSQAIQEQVRTSQIVQHVNEVFPNAPRVLARIGALINPNGFPKVFAGNEPALDLTTPLPNLGEMQAGAEAARASVVKINGRGCGGVVNGTGFVAAPGVVITNAHVVAGVARPTIVDAAGGHTARAIWFDPDLDLAILAVDGLAGQPLGLIADKSPNGTSSAALGFPGGGNFSVSPSTVLDSFTATGHNIYGEGMTQRSIYSLKGDINPGNSGGPLINTDGAVIGVIFAKSSTYEQVGYALTMNAVRDAVETATASGQTVSTGACAR